MPLPTVKLTLGIHVMHLFYRVDRVRWEQLPAGSQSRLGVITSGKIGAAVVRNRARRLLRESFRLHQHDLAQPLDLVLVARQSIVKKKFAEVEKDFLTTLRKARLLIERSG